MAMLITGAADLIGDPVAERLLARGEQLVGIVNFNPYYDPTLNRGGCSGWRPRSALLATAGAAIR